MLRHFGVAHGLPKASAAGLRFGGEHIGLLYEEGALGFRGSGVWQHGASAVCGIGWRLLRVVGMDGPSTEGGMPRGLRAAGLGSLRQRERSERDTGGNGRGPVCVSTQNLGGYGY